MVGVPREPFPALMTPGLISVVLGVRDGEGTVRRTLRSVTAQEGVPLEVLVVDDGSRDRTAERVLQEAAADPRIRLLRQAPSGLTRALRHACSEARGEFVARIDAGDRMLPGRLARQLEIMNGSPEIVVLGTSTVLCGPEGEPLHVDEVRDDGGLADLTGAFSGERSESLVGIPHVSVCFRRAAYLATGGYRPAFALAQDVDLWARMAGQGRVARLEQVLTEVRVGLDGLSARHHQVQVQMREMAARCAAIRRMGGDEGVQLATAERLSRAALAQARPDGSGAYFIASCLARRGDLDGAETYFRIAMARQPGHLRTLFGLARVRARRLRARFGRPARRGS